MTKKLRQNAQRDEERRVKHVRNRNPYPSEPLPKEVDFEEDVESPQQRRAQPEGLNEHHQGRDPTQRRYGGNVI